MPFFSKKVTPAPQEHKIEDEKNDREEEVDGEMFLILLHDLFKRYGGQRHPKLDGHETLKTAGALTEYMYVVFERDE